MPEPYAVATSPVEKEDAMMATAMLVRCSRLARAHMRRHNPDQSPGPVGHHLKDHAQACLTYVTEALRALEENPDPAITFQNARTYNRKERKDTPKRGLPLDDTQLKLDLLRSKLESKQKKYYNHKTSFMRALHDRGLDQRPDNPLEYVLAEHRRSGQFEREQRRLSAGGPAASNEEA